jgi:hypothetical protein
MSEKRLVHDILSEAGQGPKGEVLQRRPVSFIQHGNKEDGYTYEGICPWCGETTTFAPEKSTKVIGGLYRVLLYAQKLHWPSCEAQKKMSSLHIPSDRWDMAVEITTKPLNVEKKFEVQ